jgi:hypothetical protein
MVQDGGLSDAFELIRSFKLPKLKTRIANLETLAVDKTKSELVACLPDHLVSENLLRAAVSVKRAAAEIDTLLHAVGMLICLQELLYDGERVLSVSLGAGNTGKPFDLTTDRRIAEFTFIDWKGGPESARQQKVFKDFFLLVEASTDKQRCLYFLGEKHAPRVFERDTLCLDMLQKDARRREAFAAKYGVAMTVREYHARHQHLVSLQDLCTVAPVAGRIFKQAIYASTEEKESEGDRTFTSKRT